MQKEIMEEQIYREMKEIYKEINKYCGSCLVAIKGAS
jgi:hypothetical protein